MTTALEANRKEESEVRRRLIEQRILKKKKIWTFSRLKGKLIWTIGIELGKRHEVIIEMVV